MPNLPVDVNSWGRSACYPRGNFYPLSDGNSILYRRITKSYFRICSTCQSRSQAPLCLYTLRMVANHSEGTFERLRYSLGGDRPSQTVHLTLSFARITAQSENLNNQRVVSQQRLRRRRSADFLASHLSCASITEIQYQAAVKLYGVSPSSRG